MCCRCEIGLFSQNERINNYYDHNICFFFSVDIFNVYTFNAAIYSWNNNDISVIPTSISRFINRVLKKKFYFHFNDVSVS